MFLYFVYEESRFSKLIQPRQGQIFFAPTLILNDFWCSASHGVSDACTLRLKHSGRETNRPLASSANVTNA
jgi:hypothetical protein